VVEFYQIYGLKTNEICQIFLNLKALKVTIRVSGRKKCKTHIIMFDGKRLMNPITKTQRTIFETFGLSQDNLIKYINNK
jgi:hypothetical protein